MFSEFAQRKPVIVTLYALGITGAICAPMIPAIAGTLGVAGAAIAGFVGGAVLAPAVAVSAIGGAFILGKELFRLGKLAATRAPTTFALLSLVAVESVITPWVKLSKKVSGLFSKKKPQKKASALQQQPSAFKDGSTQQGFNAAADTPQQTPAQKAPSTKPKGNTP